MVLPSMRFLWRQCDWDLVYRGDRGKMEIQKVKNRIFLAGLQASLVFLVSPKIFAKSHEHVAVGTLPKV